ncbi:MAG: cytochrome c oxidase subunit II [Gemmatimonadaceae bacterium]
MAIEKFDTVSSVAAMDVSRLRVPSLQTQHFMTPAGAPAIDQATLGWALAVAASVVVVVVALLLVTAIFRTRDPATRARQPTVDDAPEHGTPVIRGQASGMRAMYVGLAITTLILAMTFAATAVAIARTNRTTGNPAVTIHIIAHQWWWEARYDDGVPAHTFTTANELHIPLNEVVRLTIESPDVIHSFWIPELAGKTDAIPGQENVAWFQAKRTGEFRGQCAEYCGVQHAHMGSVVIADSAPAYQQWATAQRSAARAVTDSLAQLGQRLFVRTCGACHAVNGTDALGVVGPDLTHVATRATIGAGLVRNTHANLLVWVRNAQLLKPGVQMPPMLMPTDELNAVVTYLESLR